MSTGLPKLSTTCLLADIGGTNARFATLVDGAVTDVRVLEAAGYPTVADAARAYLQSSPHPTPTMAALAIAAPVTGDEIRMTNHTWRFSVSALRDELKLTRLIALNDFTALAMALPHLPKGELQQFGGGAGAPGAAIALIGPGTGLGVSGLIANGDSWLPLKGEGGHVSLPAFDEREESVINVMRTAFKHVSAERAISGPGLVNLYAALCSIDGVQKRSLQPSDVTEMGLAGSDHHCAEALAMFCGMLGTVTGNLALTLGSFGGVYIGGGIVPRLGDYFVRSAFRERFENKGRYKDYLSKMPVYIIRSPMPAFYGLSWSFVDM
jgi:glucokinase